MTYTTLKELKNKEEQLSIDEHSSLNSQNGLNCVRAYRHPELICGYKKEYDRKLIETNPINRVFRLYISKTKVNYVVIIIFQFNEYNIIKHLSTH